MNNSVGLINEPNKTADFLDESNEAINNSRLLVESGEVDQAVNILLSIEKKARLAYDAKSTSLVACRVIEIYRDIADWSKVCDYIKSLIKRRAQLKTVIIEIVQLGMKWININDQVIETLSEVTKGKFFVEVERSRLMKLLAKRKEDAGDYKEAARILQSVPVETFTTMDKIEKVNYILETMRICLLNKEPITTQIASRNINVNALNSPDLEKEKLIYYKYLCNMYELMGEEEYINIAKSYYSMFTCKLTDEEWNQVCRLYVKHLILAPIGNERSDMIKRFLTYDKKRLAEIPNYKRLLEDFATKKLILNVDKHTEVVESDEEIKTLRKRILEHDLETIASFYERVSLGRLSDLLCTCKTTVETTIGDMVVAGHINASIDRPAEIVYFGNFRDSVDILNDWTNDISKIIKLIEDTTNCIEREKIAVQTK